MAPSSSLSSHLSFILLRLCALLGILLLCEQLGSRLWANHLNHVSLPSSAIQGPFYKDGQLFDAATAPPPKTRKSKAIVAASVVGDNTTWLHEFFPDWEINVYVMNDPEAEMTVTRNKGNEGSAYLSYLITHYHSLPDIVVFLHARRYQWHNDDPMYDHVPPLSRLQTRHVARLGYANLRCSWDPGCPVGLRPDPQAEDGIFGIREAYASVFANLFPHEPVPNFVAHQCCAQFAVSRDKIRERPVRYYEKIRLWLWETDLHPGRSGRILEYMWHIIFGMPPSYCQKAQDCYCLTYGMCNLTCTADACRGRYQPTPWNSAMPANWPIEGQGQNGWPKEGWWNE